MSQKLPNPPPSDRRPPPPPPPPPRRQALASNERKYSLVEIDKMRSALRGWCVADASFPGDIETILRTYMMSGASAEEVIAHAAEREAAVWKMRREGSAE